MAGQADSAWDLPLGAIVLGVRHMGLSGWQGPECMALENELTAWQQAGDFKSTETALRHVHSTYLMSPFPHAGLLACLLASSPSLRQQAYTDCIYTPFAVVPALAEQ